MSAIIFNFQEPLGVGLGRCIENRYAVSSKGFKTFFSHHFSCQRVKGEKITVINGCCAAILVMHFRGEFGSGKNIPGRLQVAHHALCEGFNMWVSNVCFPPCFLSFIYIKSLHCLIPSNPNQAAALLIFFNQVFQGLKSNFREVALLSHTLLVSKCKCRKKLIRNPKATE